MTTTHQNPMPDDLERQLKTEAVDRSPAFSLPLHQRIMRNLQTTPTMLELPPGRMSWRPLLLAAAAVILACVFLGRLWMQSVAEQRSRQSQLAIKQIQLPLDSSLDAMFASAKPVRQRLLAARFGYVDEDARRLTRFVISQLDVLPLDTHKNQGM